MTQAVHEEKSSTSWQVAVRTLDKKLPSIFRLASDDTTQLDQQPLSSTSPARHSQTGLKHGASEPARSHTTPSWTHHIPHQDSTCSDHAATKELDSTGHTLLKVLQSSDSRQLCNLSLLKTSTQHWEQDKSLYYAPAGCNPSTGTCRKQWTSSLRRSNVVPIKGSTKTKSLHDPPPFWALSQGGVLFRIPTPQLAPPKCATEGSGSTRASTSGAVSACAASPARAPACTSTSACSIRPADVPLSPTPVANQLQGDAAQAAGTPSKQAADGVPAGTSQASCSPDASLLDAPSPQGHPARSSAGLADEVPGKQQTPCSPLRAALGASSSQAASPTGAATDSNTFSAAPMRAGCDPADPARSELPGLRSPSSSGGTQRQPGPCKLDQGSAPASPAGQWQSEHSKLRYSRDAAEGSQHATYSGPPLASRRSAPAHLSTRTAARLSAISRLSPPGPAVPRLHIPPHADAAGPEAPHSDPLQPHHSEHQAPSYASVTAAEHPRLHDRAPSISYTSLSSRRYAMLMDMLPPSAREQAPDSPLRLPSARFLGSPHSHQGPQPPVSRLLNQLHSMQRDNADGAEPHSPHGTADSGRPGQGRRATEGAGAKHMAPVPLVELQSSLASTTKIKVMLNDVRDAGAHLQLCERSLIPAQHQQHLRAAGRC